MKQRAYRRKHPHEEFLVRVKGFVLSQGYEFQVKALHVHRELCHQWSVNSSQTWKEKKEQSGHTAARFRKSNTPQHIFQTVALPYFCWHSSAWILTGWTWEKRDNSNRRNHRLVLSVYSHGYRAIGWLYQDIYSEISWGVFLAVLTER